MIGICCARLIALRTPSFTDKTPIIKLSLHSRSTGFKSRSSGLYPPSNPGFKSGLSKWKLCVRRQLQSTSISDKVKSVQISNTLQCPAASKGKKVHAPVNSSRNHQQDRIFIFTLVMENAVREELIM